MRAGSSNSRNGSARLTDDPPARLRIDERPFLPAPIRVSDRGTAARVTVPQADFLITKFTIFRRRPGGRLGADQALHGGVVMDRLMAVLFWLLAALIGVVMLALYFGWWPFGSSSTF